MRYERRKEFTALLSLTSVAMAVAAAVMTLLVGSEESFLYLIPPAAATAGFAAWTMIVSSRRLKLERERKRVFLVYAREDVESARELAVQLRENSINPWLDVDEIIPGQVWQKAVLRALEESAVALVLVSKNLAKSGFVQTELEAAVKTLQERVEEMSPVIPVRLDDSEVPPKLAHIHWVSLSEEKGMDKLMAALKRALA